MDSLFFFMNKASLLYHFDIISMLHHPRRPLYH